MDGPFLCLLNGLPFPLFRLWLNQEPLFPAGGGTLLCFSAPVLLSPGGKAQGLTLPLGDTSRPSHRHIPVSLCSHKAAGF